MRKFQRHRRSLTWIASLSVAAVVAAFGASAVLAEGPACITDGQPISQEQAAADPTLCPPTDAGATDPVPAADPVTTPDASTDPAPSTPDPTGDAPTTPTDPTPPIGTDPAPTTPEPTTPTSSDPAPTPPTSTAPDGGTTDGGATQPTPATPTPTGPTRETATRPVAPRPAAPARETASATASTSRTHSLLRAKLYAAAPFRDARLFREQFTPAGRIPEQPQLSKADATVLFDASKATGTDWATLASVTWLDSRWGDPSAGSFAGRRLTPAAWAAYGTDGDGDGTVDQASHADQVWTVATYLSEARGNEGAALRAYFAGTNQLALTRRAGFLSDYFDALGRDAIVDGLNDPAVRTALQERILADEHVEIYDGGRSDIQAGLVDPRVLVTLEFLANRFDTVTVSALISGHGVYTSGGNVSLHSYGQAVDIAALDGESIVGHQQRGGRTYQAVKQMLLLPESMQPAELISLWDMGGASFALGDHDDHIHVGFKTQPDSTL